MSTRSKWWFRHFFVLVDTASLSEERLNTLVWRAFTFQAIVQLMLTWFVIGMYQQFQWTFYGGDNREAACLLYLCLVLPFLSFLEEIASKFSCCKDCNHRTIETHIVYHGKFLVFGPHANPSACRRFAWFAILNFAILVTYFFVKIDNVLPYIIYCVASFLIQLWFRYCCSQYAKYERIYASTNENEELVQSAEKPQQTGPLEFVEVV